PGDGRGPVRRCGFGRGCGTCPSPRGAASSRPPPPTDIFGCGSTPARRVTSITSCSRPAIASTSPVTRSSRRRRSRRSVAWTDTRCSTAACSRPLRACISWARRRPTRSGRWSASWPGPNSRHARSRGPSPGGPARPRSRRSRSAAPNGRDEGRPVSRARGALVIGGDYKSLGIVRSLGRRGVRVRVLRDDHLLASASRYAERSYRWRGAQEQERVGYLLDLARTDDLDGWALFPGDEEPAAMIARNRDALVARYRLSVLAPWETLRWAHDKRLTYRLAGELGIDHPRTWYPRGREDVLAFDGLFPAILKPAYRPELNRFTLAKAWLAEDARALADRYDEACANIDPSLVMIQERIPGGGECQFSFAALCRDGRPLASVVAHGGACSGFVRSPTCPKRPRRSAPDASRCRATSRRSAVPSSSRSSPRTIRCRRSSSSPLPRTSRGSVAQARAGRGRSGSGRRG